MSMSFPQIPDKSQDDEFQVRAMRDAIYGPQSNNGWQACRSYWMTDLKWLSEQYAKLKAGIQFKK